MTMTDDFRDLLSLFEAHGVRYLIVGGYAVAFHARPRYTRDLDIWIDDTPANLQAANRALAEFGSPGLLEPDEHDVILQLGVEANRIDILRSIGQVDFATAWANRVRARYGDVEVNWIGLDELIRSKTGTGERRHDDDAAILRKAREQRP